MSFLPLTTLSLLMLFASSVEMGNACLDVTTNVYTLVDINDDGSVELMADNGVVNYDVKLPGGELGNQIKNAYSTGDTRVTVVRKCGDQKIVSFQLE